MDDDEAKRPSSHEVGMALDRMSVDELESRIQLLEGEVARLRDAIAKKQHSRVTADALFKI